MPFWSLLWSVRVSRGKKKEKPSFRRNVVNDESEHENQCTPLVLSRNRVKPQPAVTETSPAMKGDVGLKCRTTNCVQTAEPSFQRCMYCAETLQVLFEAAREPLVWLKQPLQGVKELVLFFSETMDECRELTLCSPFPVVEGGKSFTSVANYVEAHKYAQSVEQMYAQITPTTASYVVAQFGPFATELHKRSFLGGSENRRAVMLKTLKLRREQNQAIYEPLYRIWGKGCEEHVVELWEQREDLRVKGGKVGRMFKRALRHPADPLFPASVTTKYGIFPSAEQAYVSSLFLFVSRLVFLKRVRHRYQAHCHAYSKANESLADLIAQMPFNTLRFCSLLWEDLVSPDWDKIKDKVVEEALAQRSAQSKALAKKIIATAPRKLVYRSADCYWGDGGGGGQNRLGELMEKHRAALIEAAKKK